MTTLFKSSLDRNNKFSSFKSRCNTKFLCMKSIPNSVLLITSLASASVYRSSFILKIASNTAPPLNSSVTTYTLSPNHVTSFNLNTFGDLSTRRISISLVTSLMLMRSFPCSPLSSVSSSSSLTPMIFIAYVSAVVLCRTLRTTANPPAPIASTS